jgi:hypothetical protein
MLHVWGCHTSDRVQAAPRVLQPLPDGSAVAVDALHLPVVPVRMLHLRQRVVRPLRHRAQTGPCELRRCRHGIVHGPVAGDGIPHPRHGVLRPRHQTAEPAVRLVLLRCLVGCVHQRRTGQTLRRPRNLRRQRERCALHQRGSHRRRLGHLRCSRQTGANVIPTSHPDLPAVFASATISAGAPGCDARWARNCAVVCSGAPTCVGGRPNASDPAPGPASTPVIRCSSGRSVGACSGGSSPGCNAPSGRPKEGTDAGGGGEGTPGVGLPPGGDTPSTGADMGRADCAAR